MKSLDRAEVRACFERRFSVDVMAQGYEAAYRTVLQTAGRGKGGSSATIAFRYIAHQSYNKGGGRRCPWDGDCVVVAREQHSIRLI